MPCFALPTTASTAAVMEQALAALPTAGREATVRRVLNAVQHLRVTTGASWPELLDPTGRTAYTTSLLRYGYGPDLGTRPGSRCPAEPPQGRAANGTWTPGWIATCARIGAERIAWAPPLLLAEMAVLAARLSPTDADMARADTLMREVWSPPLYRHEDVEP